MSRSSLTESPAPVGGSDGGLEFVKMHGAGNDFVVIDGRHRLPFSLRQFALRVCDRHFGVGADGIIALSPSTLGEFAMIYHNADGSRAICLNGMRCLSRYIFTRGLLPSGVKHFKLETDRGLVEVEIHGKGERITIDIGEPIFEGARIPTTSPGEQIGIALQVGEERVLCSAVGMGNPHCIVTVEDVAAAPVRQLGEVLEHHPFFPERTNVEFVQLLSRDQVKMRVWERGVGETLACGTGVCAVVAALVREGRCERRVAVECPGGRFDVQWSAENNRISLTGPASEVYRGQLDLSVLFDADSEFGSV